MNTLRRITRHAAKAVIAGTVTAAAALPLVGVLAAGASTFPVPSVSYLTANSSGGASVPAAFGAGFSGPGTVVLSAADAGTLTGATAASLVATPVGSTTASTSVSFTSGTIVANSGNASTISTTITSSATTATGYYNLVVTDASGTVTITDAFYVATPPTITSMSPTTVTVNSNGVAATLTGTGFESGASVTLTSATGATLPNTLTYASSTTLSGTISASASGVYLATVTNPDGGSATSTTVGVTVTGPAITSVSPSAIAYNSAAGANNTTTVTVNGSGFEAGAYITTGNATVTTGVTTLVSATQLTFPLSLSSTSTGQVIVTVHNPDGGTAIASGSIGINADSATVVPTVTGVAPALTLAVGGSAQLTITGTGFGLPSPAPADTVQFLANDGLSDSAVTCSTLTVISDTQILCVVGVSAGAISGAHSVTVTPPSGSANASAAFANGLTVAGPTITAVSPATVPAGYSGTYTLTGTGFPTTATNVQSTGATATGDQTTLAEAATLGTGSTNSLTGDTISGTGVASSTTVTNTAGSTALTLSKPTTAWLTGSGNVTIAGSTTGNVTTDSAASTSATLTVSSVAGIDVGMTVTGGGLNTGATYTVASASGTTVTLTASTSVTQTAGGSNSNVNFTETVTATQTPSAVVTLTGATTGTILVGQSVSGTGIPSNDTVASVSGSTVTLSAATTAPLASQALTFSNSGTAFSATVTSYDASDVLNGGPTLTTATVTSATSMTVQGVALTGVAGGMYVLTVAFANGTVNVAVPEVIPPVITGIAYASSSISGVGQGATNQTVYVEGSGFLSGATVSFPSGSGLSATVTSVTPNVITLSVSATSTATPAPVTVTNTTGGSATSGMNVAVDAPPVITTVTPGSVVAGAAASTITIVGSGFVTGTTVTSSTPLLTLGAVTVVNATTLTFTASGPAINGTSNVNLTLSVTNPDGGVATTPFSISTQPTVTGTYYVAPSSTNLEVFVNGTGFATSGMTVKSSSTDYTVTLAGVNSTGTQAVLLVTTDAAATQGTSSTITFTNPDGSTVSFPLNGGTAPKPPVKVAPRAIRMSAAVWTGKRTVVNIIGVGFYGQPRITSNVGGTHVGVMRDNGKVLVVVVTVAKNVHVGVHTFTLVFANGQQTSVRYNQR